MPYSSKASPTPEDRPLARPWRECKNCTALIPPQSTFNTCCGECPAGRGHNPRCRRSAEGDAAHWEEKEHDKVIKLCRRASRIHFDLVINPCKVVEERIDPATKKFYDGKRSKCYQAFWALLILAFVASLPWIYGTFVMDDACKEENQGKGSDLLGESVSSHVGSFVGNHVADEDTKERVSGTVSSQITDQLSQHIETGTAEDECALDKRMRALDVQMLLGLEFVVVPVGLVVMASILTAMLRCCSSSAGEWPFHVKRLMWKPLLWLWYFHLEQQMPRLKYQNSDNLIPIHGAYSPPSVYVCMITSVIVIQIVGFGWSYGHTLVGVLLAFGMLEIFNRVANTVFGAPDIVISTTDAALTQWRPRKCHRRTELKGPTVIEKLQKAATDRLREVSLTHSDLRQLQELNIEPSQPMEETSDEDFLVPGSCWKEGGDRQAKEGTVDDVGVITHIFLSDINCYANLVLGKISSEPDPHLDVFKRLLHGDHNDADDGNDVEEGSPSGDGPSPTGNWLGW